MAGYEVTFSEFCQLLFYGPYRETIAPLLESMFGYRLYGEGEATVVKDASGAIVELEELYQRIQNEPAKQLQFYNAAMSLWR